jgi:hypothetical protein
MQIQTPWNVVAHLSLFTRLYASVFIFGHNPMQNILNLGLTPLAAKNKVVLQLRYFFILAPELVALVYYLSNLTPSILQFNSVLS